ncbi:hypothetical protein PV325_005062 [Microctonus aethiopoides]|nr:hypothetical protein PV325_005062 [Microctonus aethiopoides]KAK0097199.1 hypothetical protein PV326_002934 [Microctonus aethiopoides]
MLKFCSPNQRRRSAMVNPGSKAAQQGVREGDLISSINGRSTNDQTNGEAHTLLRDAGDQLKLGLNQESVGSPKRRIYKSSLQENTSIETVQRTTKTTSATRILTSETKRNGTDVKRHNSTTSKIMKLLPKRCPRSSSTSSFTIHFTNNHIAQGALENFAKRSLREPITSACLSPC